VPWDAPGAPQPLSLILDAIKAARVVSTAAQASKVATGGRLELLSRQGDEITASPLCRLPLGRCA